MTSADLSEAHSNGTNGTVPQAESRRVSAACRFCRHSKLKCSGTQPCERCKKRSRECIFEDREQRAERMTGLDPPRKRVRIEAEHGGSLFAEPEIQTQNPERTGTESFNPVPEVDTNQSPRFLRNRPDKHKRRRWLYLGASSTWTFNIRVASIIRARLKVDQDDRAHSFSLDGDAYKLPVRKANADSQPDLSRLPSLDYAVYLVNTVKFQVGDILRLYDEDHFLPHLHEFYSAGPEKVGTHKLWYVQYLLLLALGKGFLNTRKSPENTSSAEFFSRAMSLLPEVFALHEEPILAVEVLTTIALYFYCIDMRQTAYSYIGQALRIALVEGMHVDLPSLQFGEKFAERCRKLWWTVYILDRTLSSAVGAPVSVQDDHIRQPLCSPQQCSERDTILVMHVKLCRVVAYILSELYTADGSLEHSYLTKTRTVVRHMAEIARELEDLIDLKFKSSLETLSKGALYLRLLYNQCILLATRPLLLCLLQQTLRSMSGNNNVRINIPNSIRDLLQTCVDSATKTLKMLWALNDHNLLDTFLPFNLEFACTAASVLIVIDDVLKDIPIPPSTKLLIDKVLDEIALGGNKAAPLRQQELRQLSQLAEQLWETGNGSSQAPVHVDDTDGQNATPALAGNADPESLGVHVQQPGSLESGDQTVSHHGQDSYTSLLLSDNPEITALSTTSSADFAQTFDFSQEQMLLLADHLDTESISSLLDFSSHGLNEWF